MAGHTVGSGGRLIIRAGGNVTAANSINTYTRALNGSVSDGGDVSITIGGRLTTTNIDSGALSRDGAGDGGDISISQVGPLTLGFLVSYTRFAEGTPDIATEPTQVAPR